MDRTPIIPLLALAGLLLASCGDESPTSIEEEGPEIRLERTFLSLIDDTDLRTVVRESEADPVKGDIIKPRNLGGDLFGDLPALRMVPDAEVRIALPPVPPDAWLDYRVGFEEDSYQGRGEVTFEVLFDDHRVLERTLSCSSDVPDEERHWWAEKHPLGGSRSVVLRTSYHGDQPSPPQAAFALLEVVSPVCRRRTYASEEAPNVILILIDTLRSDAVGAYGNSAAATPGIDRLAREGTLFELALTPSPWTVPSTAAIFTGLSPADSGVGMTESNYLPSSLDCLAEVFFDHGLATAAFSTNPLIAESRNYHQGFEEFESTLPWTQSEDVVGDVAAWLTEHAGERFFLYLHLVDPHHPYRPAERFAEAYRTERPFDTGKEELLLLNKAIMEEEVSRAEVEKTAAAYRIQYAGEVASVDYSVGHLLDKLDELELSGKTTVVVTSDHGEEFLDHGLLGHVFQLHHELVHVPLVLRGPGIPAGKRVGERVEVRFLGATLLHHAGIRDESRFEGVDLLDPEAVAASRRDPLFQTTLFGKIFDEGEDRWTGARGLHGVRLGDRFFFWSGNREAKGKMAHFLYDVASDPGEHENIADERPEEVMRFQRLIKGWLQAGMERRPDAKMAVGADLELLRDIGYIGEDDDG